MWYLIQKFKYEWLRGHRNKMLPLLEKAAYYSSGGLLHQTVAKILTTLTYEMYGNNGRFITHT